MIMPISTGGIGNIDISAGSTSKVRSKKDDKSVDAFSSLMNMASNNDAGRYDITNDKDYSGNEGRAVQEVSAKKEYKSDISKNIQKDNKADKKNTYDDGDIQDENPLDVDKVISDIKELILNKMDITEDELENLLSTMNMSPEDLTDISNLKAFILNCKEITSVDLLINEELTGLVEETTSELSKLLEEYNITDVENFVKLVKDISRADNSIEMTDIMDVSDAVIQDNKADSSDTKKIPETNIYTQTENDDIVYADVKNQDTHGKQDGGNFNSKGQNVGEIATNLNQAIENAFINNGVDDVATDISSVSEADIVRQIIDEIKVNMSSEATSLEMQLNPEHLGKVHINVTAREGIITARIYAENEAARQAIENNIAALKENFNNQEIKVEAVEVLVSAHEFFDQSQNPDMKKNQDDGNSKVSKGNLNLNGDADEIMLSDEEVLQADIMKQQGNTVNYSI